MRSATQHGNILSVNTGIILQQVNAQGVMGSGVAKAIRDKYPAVFSGYSAVIKTGLSPEQSRAHLGQLIMVSIDENLRVANLVGQQFYGVRDALVGTRYTSYDALDEALTKLVPIIQGARVHYPLIGSDRGGGHWPVVREILNHRLKNQDHGLWLQPGSTEP